MLNVNSLHGIWSPFSQKFPTVYILIRHYYVHHMIWAYTVFKVTYNSIWFGSTILVKVHFSRGSGFKSKPSNLTAFLYIFSPKAMIKKDSMILPGHKDYMMRDFWFCPRKPWNLGYVRLTRPKVYTLHIFSTARMIHKGHHICTNRHWENDNENFTTWNKRQQVNQWEQKIFT